MPGRGCRPQRLLVVVLAVCSFVAACTAVSTEPCTAVGAAAASGKPASHVKKATVVFACHLDVGFHSPAYPEPGWDNHVLSRYFNDHFPKAVRVAEELRQRGSTEHLAWLTHSWVVSLFFDCPSNIGLRCPNATTVAEVKAAVERGDIVWHALPHNAQVELYDADLLSFAVRFTHDLDRSFGLKPKITASQRDVPGLTRAVVPILAYQGVKAISVGVNGGSAPPGVPHNRPFWWRDAPSGSQLLAFWHPGGYSGNPVDSRDECVQADGLDHVLCMSWRGDNAGPPSADEVTDVFLRVRGSFPHAEVRAGGFDGFVSDLLAAAPTLDLPVVTAEIGDTWIHGAASDPWKMAEYRALLRMRRASAERYDDPAFYRFSRLLLKIPEHTWGADIKEYPNNFEIWSNADLHAKLAKLAPDDPFQVAIDSWVRQRSYNQWALDELGNTAAGRAGQEEFAALEAGKAVPDPGAANSGFVRSSLHGGKPLLFESESWQLELCPETGAIMGLRFAGGSEDSRSSESSDSSDDGDPAPHGKSWASFDAPLALPVYSTYSEGDFNTIWDNYAYFGFSKAYWGWFFKDFGKPGATSKGGAKRADYLPSAEEVWWQRDDDGGLTIVVKAGFAREAVKKAGAPQALWTEIRAPAGSPDIAIDVTWENKTPTRLPEALWLRWMPQAEAVNASSWLLYKLGQPISPLEVVLNGSQSLHAVGDEGVSVDSTDGSVRLYIRSLDAPLVSPGKPQVLPVLREKPDLSQGVSFCLVNNMWGTNYPSWTPYHGDENMRFRFLLQLEQCGGNEGQKWMPGAERGAWRRAMPDLAEA